MQKYFIHNGTDQIGPLSIEELKKHNVQKDTPIWVEGMQEWTTASEIDELKSLFTILPPPFKKAPPLQPNLNDTFRNETAKEESTSKPSEKKKEPLHTVPKKSNNMAALWITLGLVAAIVIIVVLANLNSHGANSETTESYNYESKKMSVAEIEQANPVKFLDAGGTYNQNLFGTKLKVNGVIKNSATTTAYKDVVIEVYFYSKTKTLLGTEKHIVYEVVEPNHSKSFQVKVPNYTDVNSIGWEVISAKVYN